MSKLSHSHQPTMDHLDWQRAIENGDTDCITADAIVTELVRLYRHWSPAEAIVNGPPKGFYKLLQAARGLVDG